MNAAQIQSVRKANAARKAYASKVRNARKLPPPDVDLDEQTAELKELDIERAKNAEYLLPRSIGEDEKQVSLELRLIAVDGKGANENDTVTVLPIEDIGLMLQILKIPMNQWQDKKVKKAGDRLMRKAKQHLKEISVDSHGYEKEAAC